LPNAGKSTFLAKVTAAKPKIADYPFTTLHPNLGMVRAGATDFVVADIPGLIEGAHDGVGLGTRFLGHVERCHVLLHLVDINDQDVVESYQVIRKELEAYGGGLAEKPEIVALTKADTTDQETFDTIAAELEQACGQRPMRVSSVSGLGTKEVLFKLAEMISSARADQSDPDAGEDDTPPQSVEGAWSPL